MSEAAPLKTGLQAGARKGGARDGAGRPATGRTSEVISLRVPAEVREAYGFLTAAQKRSLVSLVSNMVRARTRNKRAGQQAG